MKLTPIQLRRIIKEEISSALGKKTGDTTLRTADGKTYKGNRSAIVKGLIGFGSTGPEREGILGGTFPINNDALTYLKGQGIVWPDAPAPRARTTGSDAFWDMAQKRKASHQAEYEAAVSEFASNWSGFTVENPGVAPDDAAFDAADGFFYSYPDWQKWAKALNMSKSAMREAIADHVYEAMMSGVVTETLGSKRPRCDFCGRSISSQEQVMIDLYADDDSQDPKMCKDCAADAASPGHVSTRMRKE